MLRKMYVSFDSRIARMPSLNFTFFYFVSPLLHIEFTSRHKLRILD